MCRCNSVNRLALDGIKQLAEAMMAKESPMDKTKWNLDEWQNSIQSFLLFSSNRSQLPAVWFAGVVTKCMAWYQNNGYMNLSHNQCKDKCIYFPAKFSTSLTGCGYMNTPNISCVYVCIANPFYNFNVVLVKPLLKSGREWIMNVVIYPSLNLDGGSAIFS